MRLSNRNYLVEGSIYDVDELSADEGYKLNGARISVDDIKIKKERVTDVSRQLVAIKEGIHSNWFGKSGF